ncbi:uncharacterized protein LOC141588161 [Silene latifolia]|uniref:uncharacterized protein LOC141588161 n=1 Tax=Silene latifolia TaxID=37657 RepID=UPI003D76EBE7
MAFRYLVIPITCGRMKKADCTILVEKLIDRVRSFGSRKLSYAGKLKYQEVQWHKCVWNNRVIPKHPFVGWLIAREALQLKDRLYTLGIASDDICLLCGAAVENFEHLFRTCMYSSRIMVEVARLCEFSIPSKWCNGLGTASFHN